MITAILHCCAPITEGVEVNFSQFWVAEFLYRSFAHCSEGFAGDVSGLVYKNSLFGSGQRE